MGREAWKRTVEHATTQLEFQCQENKKKKKKKEEEDKKKNTAIRSEQHSKT
jgi:hypothetical protein